MNITHFYVLTSAVSVAFSSGRLMLTVAQVSLLFRGPFLNVRKYLAVYHLTEICIAIYKQQIQIYDKRNYIQNNTS